MIELPEAVTIAGQIQKELGGNRIASAVRGNSPHKYCFYSGDPEEYIRVLEGKTIGAAWDHGRLIMVALEPGYVLGLGDGGERIFYHTLAETVPRKHQLLLEFENGTYLSVAVQGWGCVLLARREALDTTPMIGRRRTGPLDKAFTEEHFLSLFDGVGAGDSRSLKHFMISKPGVPGVGNGYLQDILHHAGLQAKRKVAETTPEMRTALFEVTKEVLTRATKLGGRDSELDLYGRPGRYQRVMHAGVVGKPCEKCGTPIEKTSYLGGACYFCPQCQV